jgi:hypothetical protein
MVVDCVQLGVLSVNVRVVKPVFIGKQVRQGDMNTRQEMKPVERRRDSEGYLEMMSGLLRFALGKIYITERVVTSTDVVLIAFLWESRSIARDAASSAASSCFS